MRRYGCYAPGINVQKDFIGKLKTCQKTFIDAVCLKGLLFRVL